MSEPTETTVEGDVQGSVQSGAFQGPVQTVNVHVPREPEQPRTPREYLNAMWLMLLEDQRSRRGRQQHTDRWFLLIGVGVLVSLIIGISNSVWIWQLVHRLGWVWQ